MAAFLFRMPSGVPGAVSREENQTVESIPFGATAFVGYGLFGKVSTGTIVPVGAGDAATAVYGLLVRPFPTNSGTDGLGVSTPPTSGIANVLRRGYASVKCNAGTPALGGAVYIRVAAASGAKVIGGIEAAADSTNTILVASCIFTGAADASGNAEIAYNI